MVILRSSRDAVHTAAVEPVHTKDVGAAHFGGPANGHVGIGDGNNGWLPILWEGIPVGRT